MKINMWPELFKEIVNNSKMDLTYLDRSKKAKATNSQQILPRVWEYL